MMRGQSLYRLSIPALLTTVSGVILLFQLSQDTVWVISAHSLYIVFVVMLMVAAWAVQHWREVLPWLWGVLALMFVIMSYTPSGWLFGNKLLLLLMLTLITFDGLRHVRPVPHAGLLTIAVTLALSVLLTYSADRLIGAVAGQRQPGGLVFPRDSRVHYITPEFEYTVNINTYGFRGEDVDLNAPIDCRVMLLGDSFTYGWGLDYDDTWGAQLEAQLINSGQSVQILNLGVPGGNVPDYAAIAQTAVPLLQPDVILVGVLQGDDMRQMSREAGVFPRGLLFGEATQSSGVHEFVVFHYPFIAERTILSNTSARQIRSTWASTAAQFITTYTPEQVERYQRLDDTLRGWFDGGDINPHFLHLAVTAPDYWLWPLQPADTLTPYIADMGDEFQVIRDVAPDANVIVFSMPHGAYTQNSAQSDLRELGFSVPAELLVNSQVDDAIAQAATMADVGFVSLTDTFRELEASVFYPVDGHLNFVGSQHLADALLPIVSNACLD